MSLKLVELQVALPRTQDIGKLQEQIQQKGQQLQEQITTTQLKEDYQKRKQVNKHQETAKNQFYKDNQNKQNTSTSERNKKIKKQTKHDQSQHPYKGNLLDIEG